MNTSYLDMKQKLIENVLVPAKMFEKVNSSVKEAVVGDKTFKALAVYRFPFTRPGQENLNGRVYPYELWDKVFERSPVTLSLVDHPEEGAGDPARVWAVLRNPGYNADKSLAYIDCYIIDNENGRTAYGVIQAGGTLGLSSSGYGEFEADEKTIRADTFELERYCDWVMEPSYNVFGSILDVKEGDATNKNSKASVQELTASAGSNKKEEIKSMTLREKREFEASMKRIYEDIKDKDVRERIDRGKEALTFYEGVDSDVYKAQFTELVNTAQTEFEATLQKGKDADKIQRESEAVARDAADAERKLESVCKELESLKRENEQLKKAVAEKEDLVKKSDDALHFFGEMSKETVGYSDYEKLREYTKKAVAAYREMKSDRNLLQLKINELNDIIAKEKQVKEQYIQASQLQMAQQEQEQLQNWQQQHEAARTKQSVAYREFLKGVNPQVLKYYNELKESGANIEHLKKDILSKKSPTEAQLYWLRIQQQQEQRIADTRVQKRISEAFVGNTAGIKENYSNVKEWELPKGFI